MGNVWINVKHKYELKFINDAHNLGKWIPLMLWKWTCLVPGKRWEGIDIFTSEMDRSHKDLGYPSKKMIDTLILGLKVNL